MFRLVHELRGGRSHTRSDPFRLVQLCVVVPVGVVLLRRGLVHEILIQVGCSPARFPLGVSRATRAAYRELLRGITEAPTFVIPRTGRSCQTRYVARTVMLSTAPLCDNGAVSKARAQCRTGRVDEFSPASGAARQLCHARYGADAAGRSIKPIILFCAICLGEVPPPLSLFGCSPMFGSSRTLGV